MNKKGVFTIGIVIVAVLLIGYSLLLISENRISKKDDKVGGLALDVIDQEIDFQVELLTKSKDIDEKIIEFFEQGATNELSTKDLNGEIYRLWSKNKDGNINECYPNEGELLDNLAGFLDAEEVRLENSQVVINFGNYNSKIQKDGGITKYNLEYSNDLEINRELNNEISKANEFFRDIRKCGLSEECYDKLNGVKISDSYLFDIPLNDEISLKGTVSLGTEDLLNENFDCSKV